MIGFEEIGREKFDLAGDIIYNSVRTDKITQSVCASRIYTLYPATADI